MESYERLEIEWAKFNDLDPKNMVACSSGTSALHLSLEAMKLPPGSEVLTGDFSMVAVPRAIAMAGLTPVFVDCDDQLLMDWDCFCRHRNSIAKVLIAVHIYGRKFPEAIIESAKDYHHLVIEDLAEAHGVKPHESTDAACWSFYKNKIVAGEEGGAVWFKDPEQAKLARCLRSLGFTEDHDFMHVPRGHNYRMSNAHAKPILDSIARWEWRIYGDGGRREIEKWYDKMCPVEWRMPKRDAVWVYDFKLPTWNPKVMDRIVRLLNKQGIPARHGFKPMSRQPEFEKCRVVRNDKRTDSPIKIGTADEMAARVMYLPVQPGKTTEADCRRAFGIIKDMVEAGAG